MYNHSRQTTLSSGFQQPYNQTGNSNITNSTNAYRKFQHRRIYTEADEGTSAYTNNLYGQRGIAGYQERTVGQGHNQSYRKDDSASKQTEPSNPQPTLTHTRMPTESNPLNKEQVSSKPYKFIAKPNLYSKYIKTEPDEQPHKSKPTNSNKLYNNSKYEIEGIAGKGTFGVVYFGKVVENGQKVAMKKVLQDKKYKNRELEILKEVKHTNILEMKDHFFSTEGSEEYLNVVMDYFSDNLYQVVKKKELTPLLIKLYSYQMLRGLNYLSTLSISHRDIKPQNILVDRNTHKLVICDFGSAKKLVKGEPNIAYICSRCYRAPELIFGATEYSPMIDVWSAGCVIVQMINGEAPFLGDSQIDQLLEIIRILGTPQKDEIEEMNPKYDLKDYNKFPNIKPVPWRKILKTDDPLLIDLISKILEYSPTRRTSAANALKHPYFDELKELDIQDEEYLKSMKVKSIPELFNLTNEELTLLENNKKEINTNPINNKETFNIKNKDEYQMYKQTELLTNKPINHSKDPISNEYQKSSHIRNHTEISYKPTYSYKDYIEGQITREEPIKNEKKSYLNTGALGIKPIQRKITGNSNNINLMNTSNSGKNKSFNKLDYK